MQDVHESGTKMISRKAAEKGTVEYLLNTTFPNN